MKLILQKELREKISKKRDAIRGVVEEMMRREIAKHGGDADLEIENLDEHVTQVIRLFANKFRAGDASLSGFFTRLSHDDNRQTKERLRTAIEKAVRDSL